MLETYVRPIYQRCLVDPVAQLCQQRWATLPLHVTLASVGAGICAALAIYAHLPTLGIVLLLLSGYFDTLDGSLARLQKQATDHGAMFDIIADRVVEFAIVFALFALDPTGRAAMALVMLGSILICVTSFLVVGIYTANESHKGFHYSPGIMERAEAFIFFILMILLPQCFIIFAAIFSLLVALTAAIRIIQFVQISTEMPADRRSI